MLLQLLLAQLFLVSRAGDRDPLPGDGTGVPLQPTLVLPCGMSGWAMGCGEHEAFSARPSRDPAFPPSRAKACEELLRYAVYNCMSIDTDKNTWDE